MEGNDRGLQVLVIEDSPGPVRLAREASRDTNPAIHLRVANDGEEALAFLRREGSHTAAPLPLLILLDLNLPKMEGRRLRAIMKSTGGR